MPALSHGATELRDGGAMGLRPRAKLYIGVVLGTERVHSSEETNPFIFLSVTGVPLLPQNVDEKNDNIRRGG